jgi:hypothetical protein
MVGKPDRSLRRNRIASHHMGDEIMRGKGPQGFIEPCELRRVGMVKEGLVLAAMNLAGQPAGVAQWIRNIEVEVDPGHGGRSGFRSACAQVLREQRYGSRGCPLGRA